MVELLRRHKNKLLLTALAATGLYGAGRYVLRILEERRSFEALPSLHSSRLLEHCRSNHATTVSAVLSVAPRLADTLSLQLNTDAITQQLKTKPSNKVALWDDLKSLSFARLVASVYSSTLLASFMSVQLSILGGCMFQDLHKSTVTEDAHKSYLAMVEHLLSEGVVGLCEAVCRAADTVLAPYSLKEGVTCQGLEQLLRDVQHSTASLGGRSRRCFLIQFALPQESLVTKTNPDLSAAMRDVLESQAFSEVLETCLEVAFTTLTGALTQSYHSASQSLTVLPLARLIPMVTDHTHIVFGGEASGVMQSVLEEQKLLTFSQNIYESFSQK
ncbi:peroxisomal biogenesis factor 3-like [Halichondria panicea]|uniref:peroxisomal biogenesis factor 3-like n=1 Tax=Halichondria panicea TaxID=6063 RepID=UPI00312BA424